MVWPWPNDPHNHDPMDWSIGFGRYNPWRWREKWQQLFDTHRLVHNNRVTQMIEVSPELDGAFAVVDIDTLWRDKNGNENHWKGRTCKVFSKVGDSWKMTMHTGVLIY